MKFLLAALSATCVSALGAAGVLGGGDALTNYLLLDSVTGHHGGYYYGGHHGGLGSLGTVALLGGGLGGTGLGQGVTDYLLIDSLSGHHGGHYYRGHHGHGGYRRHHGGHGLGTIGTLALAGGLGGVGTGLSAGVTDYLVMDQFLGHHGYYGGHGNFGAAMALTGNLGTIGASPVGQAMALNHLAGGSSHDMHDILPFALTGTGNPAQLVGMSALAHGSHNPVALMAATGTGAGFLDNPLAITALANSGSHHGRYYTRRGMSTLGGAAAGHALATAVGVDPMIGALAGGHRARHYGSRHTGNVLAGAAAGHALAGAVGMNPMMGAVLGGRHASHYGLSHRNAGAIGGAAIATAAGVDPIAGALVGARHNTHGISSAGGAVLGSQLAVAAGADPLAGAILGGAAARAPAHAARAPAHAAGAGRFQASPQHGMHHGLATHRGGHSQVKVQYSKVAAPGVPTSPGLEATGGN